MSDDFRPFTAVEVGNRLAYIRLKPGLNYLNPIIYACAIDSIEILLCCLVQLLITIKKPASTLKKVIYQDNKIKIIVMVFSSDTVLAPSLIG